MIAGSLGRRAISRIRWIRLSRSEPRGDREPPAGGFVAAVLRVEGHEVLVGRGERRIVADRREIGALDRRLIRLLSQDGRKTNRELARSAGTTEPTVRSRIRRLARDGVMRVVAVTDMEAAGYEFYVLLWIQTDDRPVRDVAVEIAALPSVFTVVLMSGVYDVMAGLVARSKGELTRFSRAISRASEGSIRSKARSRSTS